MCQLLTHSQTLKCQIAPQFYSQAVDLGEFEEGKADKREERENWEREARQESL